jgi:hypothetical protein
MFKNFMNSLHRIWNPWPLNPVKIPDGAFAVSAETDKFGTYVGVERRDRGFLRLQKHALGQGEI